MMKELSLSRSSWAYKFVFGQQAEYSMYGFVEPQNNRISLGLFGGMFLFMVVLRPISFVLMTFFEVVGVFVSFLVDGSYIRGSFPMDMEIIKIEPWPTLFGRRVSPWIMLAIGTVSYQFMYVGTSEALFFFAGFAFITWQFMSIKPGDKSVAMVLAESTGPVIDEKLVLTYYREPKLFPPLYLVP